MDSLEPSSPTDALGAKRAEEIRGHLAKILSSSSFVTSKRAQEFLQLVVEHAIEGRPDQLKERMIGAAMFGRPVNYDTANDSVVRVKATEVRKKLAQFYQEHPGSPIRIDLPPGSYIPVFGWAHSRKSASVNAIATDLLNATSEVLGEAETDRTPNLQEKRKRTPRTATVILYLLTIVIVFGVGHRPWRFWSKSAASNPVGRSILILPLKNLSSDPSQDYFADGITEELISSLGQVSALRVISRTSSMSYKFSTKTVPQIASELAVDVVLEGAITHEGKTVRISTRLMDAKTEKRLWAQDYVREVSGVFALEGEISQTIADEIRVHLTPQEKLRLARPSSIGTGAEELYLLGRNQLNLRDPQIAISYLLESLRKDPDFAPSHAALASAYGWLGEAGILAYRDAFSKQKAEAMRAIELDESLADGHAELANAEMNLNWDWKRSGSELERALALNPNSAQSHVTNAFFLARQGRQDESAREVTRDLELDPVSSRSFMNAALIYYFNRQYERALGALQKANLLDPNPSEVFFPAAVIFAEKGMNQDAIDNFKKIGDRPHAVGHLGNLYARMGKVSEAERAIVRLKGFVATEGIGRYEIALVYAGLGRKSEAFDWLNQSLVHHDKGITYLKVDPCLDSLRLDPRFSILLERLGLSK